MKIKSNITLINGYYEATLSLYSMDSAEKDRLAALGPFSFVIGGAYTAEGLTFTLPTKTITLLDLPVKQAFAVDIADDEAIPRTNLWVSENLVRISEAEAAWKLLEIAEGLGDNIHNLPSDGTPPSLTTP
jgi:hypothetical protein